MRLNITESDISLEDLKATLNIANNLKDVHLLCHQAGCPVYLVRDEKDCCAIMWHPNKDDSKNVIKMVVTGGIAELIYEGATVPFKTLEELCHDFMTKHMVGDKPFDERFCLWKKNE